MSLKKIAVVGANGRQGSSTIDALVELNFDVVGLVRNEKKKALIEAKGSNVRAVIADFDDLESLKRAFEGCDGLYLYFPMNFNINSAIKQMNNVINAAKAQDIKFVVYSNGILIRPGSGLSAFDKAIEIEDKLLSELPSCIIKPSAFLDDLLQPDGDSFRVYTTSFHCLFKRDVTSGYISTQDIGKVAANIFTNPTVYRNRKIPLASEVLTGQQLLDIVCRLRGTEFEFKVIPWPLVVRLFVPGLIRFAETLDANVLAEAETNMRTINPACKTVEKYLESREFAGMELRPEPTSSCVMC